MIIRPLLSLSLLLIATAERLSAAEPEPAPPDLTQGGKRDECHDWLLGPTGARGWVSYRREDQTAESRQILVTAVAAGSPADGVLRINDVILGVKTIAEIEKSTDAPTLVDLKEFVDPASASGGSSTNKKKGKP